MPTVLLVRHAQASFGADDYDVLSQTGERQAERVFDALEQRGVAAARLVAGTMRRQRDSALPWTRGGAELLDDERWNEYDAADVLGAHSEVAASLEGGDAPASSREFQGLLDPALAAWVAAGDGGGAREGWPAFRARAVAALEDAAAALGSGETAIAFTSGGVIAACALAVLGVPDAAFVPLNRVAVNGAVTKVISGRRGLSLVSYNEHGHLERDGLVTYR
jgi:broad specificity phosphatase PhoE